MARARFAVARRRRAFTALSGLPITRAVSGTVRSARARSITAERWSGDRSSMASARARQRRFIRTSCSSGRVWAWAVSAASRATVGGRRVLRRMWSTMRRWAIVSSHERNCALGALERVETLYDGHEDVPGDVLGLETRLARR
jgi:hypothetical protein